MAYVEVWKGGKLITRRPVSEERAQKGCRIRLGSAGQVHIKTGETKTVGKFEVRMFAGYIPVAGQEPTLSTSAGTGASGVTEEAGYIPEIEGYKVTGRLGEGGMGTVWRAVQLSTHREVALKLLSERRFESRKSRLRFEREVELTARLVHPNIARLYDSGLYRGVYYYAMELIDGVPLDEYVQQNQLSRMEILKLIYQVSEAVGYAHEQGIIHRDLKPSNILVSEDGQPHVLDFGLAKSTAVESEDVTVSIEGEIAGTPAYMAPEQASGNIHAVGTRTDVYSLGVLLYYLLTGQLPYDIEGGRYEVLSRIIQDEVPSPRKIDPSIDRELEAILMTALAKEPNERYPSAVVLKMDIDNYLKDEPILAKMTGTAYYLVKKIKKHRIPVSVGVLVFLLIFSVILIAYTKIIQSNTRIRTIRGELEIQKQAVEMAKSEADSFKARWDDLEATVLSGRKEKDVRAAMLALKEEYLRTQKLLEGTPEERTAIQAVAENYLNIFGQYKEDSFKALKPVFSDSCISFDSDGRAFKGPQESIAHLMQTVKSSAEKFDFDKTANETATIQVSGNNAFMIGQLISHGQARGKNELVVVKQWYMLIFQKIHNKWLIASEYCAPPEIIEQNPQHVLYVDKKAQGNNSGSSWSGAYRHLQDALAAAEPNSNYEIWVAQGTYQPDEDTSHPDGNDSRTATFQLKNNIAIYGGFPSGGGTWASRNPNIYKTTLSGDLAGNDVEFLNLEDLRDHLSRAENSYHVVTTSDTDATAILDGFVITGGNANNNKGWPQNRGGGMIGFKSSPTIINCTFKENSAVGSGGIHNRYGSPVYQNCLFIRNAAWGYEGDPGTGNTAALDATEGIQLVINCRFIGNMASHEGGAIFVWTRGNPLIVNCIFSGNRAGNHGGAILNWSNAMVYNCTFSNNFAPHGGATIYNFTGSHVTLNNCIIWSDNPQDASTAGSQIYSGEHSGVAMNFCCVKDIGYRDDKRGLMGLDPIFLDPDGPDGEIGTLDDNVKLGPGSPCIDAGNNAFLPLDITDLDQDDNPTEQIPLDFDNRPRVVNEQVDMGAYEYQGRP